MEYEIVQTDDPDRGPWKISTRKYMYHVVTDDHMEVVLFHWHPDGKITWPHFHIGSSQLGVNAVVRSDAHIPGGRISLEQVVKYLIDEQSVVPRRGEWTKVIGDNDEAFTKWQTWR